MMKYQRLIIHHGRKEEKFRVSIEEGRCLLKRAKQKFIFLLFLSLLSCCFVLSPYYIFGFSTFSLLDSFTGESEGLSSSYEPVLAPLCSDISNGTICCDRTGLRSDICIMKGGYTGNVYHEFNDGLIPLFITSQHFNKKVVFVIVEYHDWWEMKYGDIVSELSDYPVVDFNGDSRTHCFKEATIGLRIHDELTVNSTLMIINGNNQTKTIVDFRNVLDRAFSSRIQSLMMIQDDFKKPKLVILSRNGSRAILNENHLIKLAEETGFNVEVLRPDKRTEMAKLYQSLNTSDVMIGVHGAAMTHFLFMKPKTVFIQIVPLGTDWAAEAYYGEPAKKFGLKYVGYKIRPEESSLYDEYGKDDPVIRDPESLNEKGWEYTKKIYLQGQNVKLDLRRFRKTLTRAYEFSIRSRLRQELPRTVVT